MKYISHRILPLVLLTCLALGSLNGTALAQTSNVPAQYQSLYNHLGGVLSAEESKLDTLLSGAPKSPITFAAELTPVNCNRGSDLLKGQVLSGTNTFLDRLQELGIQAVKFCIHYPLLTPDFPQSSDLLAFFQKLMQNLRQRHIKVVIQVNVLFANTPYSSVSYSYKGLTFDQFKTGMRQQIQTITQQLQPDYLVVLSEPDTAARLTGLKELNDPARALELVQYVFKGLNKGGTLVGSGSGSWSPLTFTQEYVTDPDLDFICIHIYPVNPPDLDNVLSMANLAKQNHKRTIIDEAWMHKNDSAAVPEGLAASTEVSKLNVFSFWSPLDQQFLKVVTKLASAGQIELISPYETSDDFAYVDWSAQLDTQSYQELRQRLDKLASDNIQADTFSQTGLAYKQIISTYSSASTPQPTAAATS